ncbi:MAG: hypothetical protein ACK58T_00925, partial [Phycisphaerae bacterium]
VTRADGKIVRYNYQANPNRRLASIESESQNVTVTYVNGRSQIQNLVTSDGSTLFFQYDGDSPVTKNYFGLVNSGITMNYQQNGRLLNSMNVGGSIIAISYNSDQEPNAV